jgi:hypothetical protein
MAVWGGFVYLWRFCGVSAEVGCCMSACRDAFGWFVLGASASFHFNNYSKTTSIPIDVAGTWTTTL